MSLLDLRYFYTISAFSGEIRAEIGRLLLLEGHSLIENNLAGDYWRACCCNSVAVRLVERTRRCFHISAVEVLEGRYC